MQSGAGLSINLAVKDTSALKLVFIWDLQSFSTDLGRLSNSINTPSEFSGNDKVYVVAVDKAGNAGIDTVGVLVSTTIGRVVGTAIAPDSIVLGLGSRAYRFKRWGSFSDGATRDLTETASVTFFSSDTSVILLNG